MSPFNTNRQARQLRKHLGLPAQYTHSPWQWGYVAAVHASRTTTLSSNVAAGAQVITTAASIEANAMIVVGKGGPVQVLSVSGAGPFTLTLANRGVPIAQNSGATVRVLATVDLYLDGWQNPPQNLPSGVTKTLTTGVRYLSGTVPVVGQVGLIARGTGLQRSDRVFLGAPAAQSSNWMTVASTVGYAAGWSDHGGGFGPLRFRKVGDLVQICGVTQSANAPPSTIFTLPPGYRPTVDIPRIALEAAAVLAVVQVQASGAVQLANGSASSFLSFGLSEFTVT